MGVFVCELVKSRIRARVIAEWRGLPEPPPAPDRLISVADGVKHLMNSLGLGERLREEEVRAAWRAIVGDFLAGHSRPNKLQKGTLLVQVLQPAMLYEFDRVLKAQILAKLRERFGAKTIREVRFRIG